MKKIYIKKIKKCFGKKADFFKRRIEECKTCQFKRRCLEEVNTIKKNKKKN